MVISRGLERAAPSIECPRCGSALVVPAMPGGPSENVLQLRSGSPPTGGVGPFDEWLCRSCGLRWPHERPPAEVALGAAAAPGSAPSAIPGERIDTVDLPEVEGASAVTSGRVATTLREAREARGLTVSDAAKATRIWERYLQALEANAPLQEFPAPVYARSFLRAYAEFLELDTDSLVRRFDEDHPVPEDPILEPLPVLRPRRRAVAGALVFVSVLALLAMAAARLQGDREDGPAVSSPATASTSGALGGDPVTRAPLPPRIDGIRAVLRLDDRCWVVAVADGDTLEPGTTLEAGGRVVFRADRILQLELGSAGAVDLEVNGETVRTGILGEVVTLELRWRDGELVTTVV
jgi:transcriptional regulator with XRE-family HTH domain